MKPLLAFILAITACATDDGAWVEAGADGKADGWDAPPPNGSYHVQGAAYYGYTIWESINDGPYEVIDSSGVSGDGYHSWDSYYPDVDITANADDTIEVTVDDFATGVLQHGVNWYADIYSGQLGSADNGVRVHDLRAQRWNTTTNVVDRIYIRYRSTRTSVVGSKRWDNELQREVTVSTKTARWSEFDTGLRPGFHR